MSNKGGELAFLKWMMWKFYSKRRIDIDVGDDSAAFKVGKNLVLITTDQLIDGVHFKSQTTSPELIGRKIMAKNLSDIAAMGCYPTYAVTTFAVPRGTSMQYLKKLYMGVYNMARGFGVLLIGGDLASHNGKLQSTIALLGENRGLKPITRSGAKVGDRILVTGSLGGSILGKHLTFTPRVKEAIALNKNYKIRSMIDVSDGLVRDVGHICEQSKVGAVFFENAIPISKDAVRISKSSIFNLKSAIHNSPLWHALYDGEDYELAFTAPAIEAIKISRKFRFKIIGRIVKGNGIFMNFANSKIAKLKDDGYEHEF